ncbi:putative Zinc finger CCCH domain-containing protein 48 [Nannochloris sp. 'desiccata']|nr:putative Zinc finger CCCH domain-containing protein 48 [Chlorella desiccata (nom. nud.)]
MDTGEGGRGGRGGGRYNNRGRGRGDQYYSGGGGRYGGGMQQQQQNDQYYQGGSRGGGGGRGGYHQAYNQSYGNFNQGGYRGGARGRGYWGGRGRSPPRGGRGGPDGGRGGRGAGGREPLPDDVESLSELKGHTKKVTCLELDQASGQLFTGSHDGTVRVWSCTSGECTSTVPVGGEVDSMLIEGGFLFAGVKSTTGQGVVKAWNMATNQEMVLEGHTGRVQCLAAGQGMLFSGGQDQTIRVWKPNAATGMFECAAILRAEHNGHTSSISSMCVSQHIMFSGDAQGGIKVWDLNQGAVIQSLDKAHSDTSHPAIMSMLIWEGHLVTGSLDGYIKVWEPADPSTGTTISGTPIFIFPEAPPQQAQQGGGRGGGRSKGRGGYNQPQQPPLLPGVLSLCGVADPAGKAVVMVSYNGESAIRLWELPSFADRGALADVSNVRSMAGFPAGRLMISGDERGRVKVWRWKDTAAMGLIAGAAAAAPGGFS